MNRYARDMAMRRMRDGRNPYGSRGGYVRSDRTMRREDYARGRYGMDSNYDGRRYDDGNDYANYDEPEYDMASRDYERGRQSRRDYGYGYGVGMFDYDTEDWGSEEKMRLTSKDIKKWEKHMENADGTTGKHFETDQVRQVAQQLGIRFEEYSPELLTAITNMMYSDYCKLHGNDIMSYVKMARAFLDDDDFDGTPEEKAYLYYKCIVEKD